MGDGTIVTSNKNPYIEIRMMEESMPYLKYLDSKLGWLSNGINLRATAGQKAKDARKSGIHEDATKEAYSDFYGIKKKSHPQLDKFVSWYDSGSKQFPENIDLTPTVLKHWYVGDGHYDGRVRIGIANEYDNENKIEKMFESAGLPTHSTWHTNEVVWKTEPSKELLEYMGKPLPSFEYKWPQDAQLLTT